MSSLETQNQLHHVYCLWMTAAKCNRKSALFLMSFVFLNFNFRIAFDLYSVLHTYKFMLNGTLLG